MAHTPYILDALRDAFTPYVESCLLVEGDAVHAVHPRKGELACSVCQHPVAYSKGRTGKPLCAACLSLSAKMPCHSDSQKAPISRGLSPCNPKGGGMGFLITPDALHLFVKEDKFDLVFLDMIPYTGFPVVSMDHFIRVSTDMAMALPDATEYFWGIIQKNDIYPTLEWLRSAPWDIAQDTMRLHHMVSDGNTVFSDSRKSWQAVSVIKSNADYVKLMKSVKRITQASEATDRQQKKLATLPWADHPGCARAATAISESALQTFF